MEKQEQIRQALKELARQVGPETTLLGTVKSVDEQDYTCVLHDDESRLDFPDVRLRPVLDGKEGLTLFPKPGTWALAIRIEDSEDWVALAFGEIDKYHLRCDQVLFNDGLNGGLVNWPGAKAQLDRVVQFIDAIKDTAGTPINEPGNGAPSAFQAALNIALTPVLSPDFDDLENEKVKH